MGKINKNLLLALFSAVIFLLPASVFAAGTYTSYVGDDLVSVSNLNDLTGEEFTASEDGAPDYLYTYTEYTDCSGTHDASYSILRSSDNVQIAFYNNDSCTYMGDGVLRYDRFFGENSIFTGIDYYIQPDHNVAYEIIGSTAGEMFNYVLTDDTDPEPPGPGACTNTNTQICELIPEDGVTLTGPDIEFGLTYYINPSDVGSVTGIEVTLHNIDQNVLLLANFSPSDIYLYKEFNDEPGQYTFSTTTPIGNGNYRIEACLERAYFGGWINNPFANVVDNAPDCISHQFVVGTSTYIGTLSQNGYDILQSIYGSSTATSTPQGRNCVPLTEGFSVEKCGAFLFIPDANYLNVTMNQLRTGVLNRVPWGYLTRVYNIFSATSTSALPTFTASFITGSNQSTTTQTLTYDPGDMLAGAGSLLTDTRDPFNGKNLRDIMEPIIQLVIAVSVIFTIAADIAGSHKHHTEPSETRNQKRT